MISAAFLIAMTASAATEASIVPIASAICYAAPQGQGPGFTSTQTDMSRPPAGQPVPSGGTPEPTLLLLLGGGGLAYGALRMRKGKSEDAEA